MIALIIIGLTLGLASLIIGDHYIEKSLSAEHWWRWVYAMCCVAGFLCYTIGVGKTSYKEGNSEGYDQGQIDALHGIQTHGAFYVYPKGDTIPSDTLYLKIEE